MPRTNYFILGAGNYVYEYAYFLYKPLYFAYKKISERREIALLTASVKPGMTVLDIGANIGFYSLLFSKLVGDEIGKVYAFEPDTVNYRHLMANTGTRKNISVKQLAVGAKTDKINLYHSDTLNVDHQTYDSGENRNFREVRCVAIDDFLERDEKIDFIKLDIQGYEYFAIKGMKETIKRSSPLIISGEIWPYALYKAGSSPAEYIRTLKSMGFELTIHGTDDEKEYEK